MPDEHCPGCGMSHSQPFDNDVFGLARRILSSKSVEERQALLCELADLYIDRVDWTDLSLPEELHVMVEDHLRAKTDVAGTSSRLGRLLLRLVGAYDQHARSDIQSEEEEGTELPAIPDLEQKSVPKKTRLN